MKITSNYATFMNSKDYGKPVFQAKLDRSTHEYLQEEAEFLGLTKELDRKIDIVSKWGDKNSIISSDAKVLSLANHEKSSNFEATFIIPRDQDKLLYFLNLSEEQILNAERYITQVSRLAKLDAIQNIVINPTLTELVTGEPFPSDEKLEKSIKEMSETELLRFCADKTKINENYDDFT